jgi:DNA-binding CsgD family transcriptional regulator/tetratricopeptide (TPR) repeat protein
MHADAADHALARWPLTGRDALVSRAVAGLGGSIRTIVVSGESGAGKTRVAEAIGEAVAADGWTVLHASATGIMSTVPLGALLPLLPLGEGLVAPPADPGALLHAAIAAVERRGPAPRLLVLDDLSVLDPLSTILVAQLVAVDAVRLVATIRDGEPLPDPFVSTWNPDRAMRLSLAPLDVTAVADLLASVLGAPVAHRAVAELHRESGGNPLYLRELVLGALDSGRLSEQSGVWHLEGTPVGSAVLRDLISARLAQLDPDERDVVDRLAVCGEIRAAHLTAPGARPALARLERAGLVSIDDRLRVRLAHPQYVAVAASTLSRLRTADLLLEQAALLEADGVDPADGVRVLSWRLSAGAAADPDALAEAARWAQYAGDHRTVERLAAAGLATSPERADLLLLRGEALLRMGRVTESLDVLADAARHAPDGELSHAVAAARALAFASVHEGLTDALSVLRASADCDDTAPSLLFIRSLVELYTNNVVEADRIVAGLDRRFGSSPAERAIIASARAQPLAALGRTDEAREAAETAVQFARATDGKAVPGLTIAGTLSTLATVHLNSGDIDLGRAAATEALVDAIGADDEIVTRSIEYLLARLEADAGRLESSARWARDTMSGAMTAGPISLYIPALTHLAIVLTAQGDREGARALLDSIPEGVDAGPGGLVARSWIAALDGDLETGRRLLLPVAEEVIATGHVFLAGALLMHLTRMGNADAAAAPLAVLAAAHPGDLLSRQARHTAAEVAGDATALAAVGEEWSRSGAHLVAAEAFASAARAARAAGEQRTAVALQARCDEEASKCEGAATPLLRFTEELTPLTRREREIASLASEGHSSKEIAQRLYLSVRTVDNHLQSVYTKLGISGRHELTRL